MKRLDAAMREALLERADLEGLACIDLRKGKPFHAAARDARAERALEQAASAARDLVASTETEARSPEEAYGHHALVVSDNAVHAFARTPGGYRVVVGIARPDANVGLLLSCLEGLARSYVEEP